MRLDQEVGLGVGALLFLQLVTAFTSIALLARTGPAIEDILVENVASIEAVDAMLAELAAPEPDRLRFAEAFQLARDATFVPDEAASLDHVAARADAAMLGDPVARAAVVAELRHVANLNRRSMEEGDRAARRMSRAGAWAAVLLGIVTFAVGNVVYRRMRTRLEWPILEMDEALRAVRLGDIHRRCVALQGPKELERVAHNLNWLLDRTLLDRAAESEERLRSVVLTLLDARPEPMLVVDPTEGILAMNQRALDLLDTDEREGGLFELLRVGESVPGWKIEQLGRGGLRLAIRVD